MNTITDHRTLLDALGGNTVVANHLATPEDACPPVRVGQWKISNSIPAQYWPELILMAAEHNLMGINADWFMRRVPRRKMPQPHPENAAA